MTPHRLLEIGHEYILNNIPCIAMARLQDSSHRISDSQLGYRFQFVPTGYLAVNIYFTGEIAGDGHDAVMVPKANIASSIGATCEEAMDWANLAPLIVCAVEGAVKMMRSRISEVEWAK